MTESEVSLPSDDEGLPSDDEGLLSLVSEDDKPVISKTPSAHIAKRRKTLADYGYKKGELRRVPKPKGPSLKCSMDQVGGQPTIPMWLSQQILEMPPSASCPPDDFLEVFSVPRVVMYCRKLGLRAQRSMDIANVWDLMKKEVKVHAFQELAARRPKIVGLTPPCTMFSNLMDLNWYKMDVVERAQALENGIVLLDVAMWIAQYQMDNQRGFYYTSQKLETAGGQKD